MTLTAAINPVVPLNLIFPIQRVICPQSRQSVKYRIVTHNFTIDYLTNGKTLVINDIFSAAGVQNNNMGKWPGFAKNISPNYVCGICPDPNCHRDHRQFFELPLKYVENLHHKIKSGAKMIQEKQGNEGGRPLKKRRTTGPNEE